MLLKNAPLKIWAVSVFCLLSPSFFDQNFESISETSWFLHLIVIYFVTYYSSFRAGVAVCFFSIMFHGIWEAGEYFEEGVFDQKDFEVLLSVTFMKLTTLVGVGFLTKKILQNKEDLETLAYHDSLTGLPNRYMINKNIKKTLSSCKQSNQKMGVLFIDLDRFKMVNDTLGHDAGDDLLKQAAKRLIRSVRKSDVVARLGGDEFIVLLKVTDQHEINEIASRILHAFSSSFSLKGENFFISPSIGVSMYPKDGEDIKTLIKNADQAMYLAKEKGRNNFQFFVLEDAVNRKMKLQQDLQKALVNDEFTLYYQPKINLSTNKIVGTEALLRWQHPELGTISPLEFIPLAEETGLILPIGKWVLETACKQTKEWQEKGFYFLSVAVNVSVYQFRDKRFVEHVNQALQKNELSPHFLEVEITESLMQNIKESKTVLTHLKTLGVKISIDDFGTGYSSLNVLHSLPIDYIKIDQSFIREIFTNDRMAAIVKTIIAMGHNLGFELIAEGIETEEQAAFLKQHNCHIAQGYLYTPPLPAGELEQTFKKKSEKVEN